jgi:predicted MFS family arabinose efflux permease
VAIAAGLAAAVGTGLIAGAPNAVVLAVGVVIGGSSTGLASPPVAAAVTRWVPAERADRVQTVVNAGTGLGVSVSGPVALLLFHSWRLAWAVFCVLAVLVTIWTAIAVPGGADPGSASPPTAPVVGLLTDATSPAVAFCAAALVTVSGAFARPRPNRLG